jgi:VanZ family protein
MSSGVVTLLCRIGLGVALLCIGGLAVVPGELPAVASINDKLQHMAAFLSLALLTDFAFPRLGWNWRKFVPLLAYGLLLELIQYYLPHRSFSLADLAADALALALYALLRRLLHTTLRWRLS